MTDSYDCKIDGCEYDGETLSSLRSHVAATKDDPHQEARKAKAWEEWYPDEGASEGGSDPSDEGTADPGDDDPEADPSEPTDGEGDDGGSTGPSKGGPDPSEEYAEQWSAGDTGGSSDESGGSEGGSDPSDPSDGGSAGSSGQATGGDNGIGAGVALAAGSALVGLIVLLTRDKDDEEPIEVESTAEDVDPAKEGDATPSGGGWSTVEGGDGW